MVAYSFKARFVPRIEDGTKPHTIRAHGKRRHARLGEDLQLYTAMRTRQCRLIGTAVCIDSALIDLYLDEDGPRGACAFIQHGGGDKTTIFPFGMDRFAIADGFSSWAEMRQFWAETHPGIGLFSGVMVTWGGFRLPRVEVDHG